MPKRRMGVRLPLKKLPTPYVSLLDWIDEIPPFFVRALAIQPGTHRRPMRIPVHELVQRSGIKTRRLKYISRALTWEDVTVGDTSRLMEACEFDSVHRCNMRDLIRNTLERGNLKHLTVLQRRSFDELTRKWVALMESRASARNRDPK